MTPKTVREYIDQVVAEAPPLTNEQKDRLVLIMRGSGEIEPPPRTPVDQATTVYRHYDKCGCLLYIGVAYDAVKRSYAHAGSSWWTKWTDRIQMQELTYDDRPEALAAEREFIQSESPVFNKVHADDRDGSIVRYLISHERWEHLAVAGLVTAEEMPEFIRMLERAGMLRSVMWTKEPRS